jgi:hypothetical protein
MSLSSAIFFSVYLKQNRKSIMYRWSFSSAFLYIAISWKNWLHSKFPFPSLSISLSLFFWHIKSQNLSSCKSQYSISVLISLSFSKRMIRGVHIHFVNLLKYQIITYKYMLENAEFKYVLIFKYSSSNVELIKFHNITQVLVTPKCAYPGQILDLTPF